MHICLRNFNIICFKQMPNCSKCFELLKRHFIQETGQAKSQFLPAESWFGELSVNP